MENQRYAMARAGTGTVLVAMVHLANGQGDHNTPQAVAYPIEISRTLCALRPANPAVCASSVKAQRPASF